MLFSFTLIPPVIIDFIYQENAADAFFTSYLSLLAVGFVLWLPVKNSKKDLRLRDGFIVVVLFWFILSVSGTLPLLLYEQLDISITDAFFESVSGLTTTGATVLTGLDDLPHSILFYRQELQWLGGMGIIVLAVAVLPMLGIGGMQLYKAETPGPIKDNKLTPRITETAKALWYIYLTLTVTCALSYWAAGMNLFDAVTHSFSTVAIGGFSTHDASLGYFDSVAIKVVAIVFMFLGGVNFALHFVAFRNWNVKAYINDTEFKVYFRVLILVSIIVVAFLHFSGATQNHSDSILLGVFHVVSMATTTGFSTTEFHLWPTVLPVLLIFTSFIGGCAGSTGGGMKVIRVILLLKQGVRELQRLIHPNAVILVKIGKKPVADSIIDAVWGFFAIYVAVFVIMMLLLMATGLDQVTSFSAVAATLNNLGPGLGDVASNYSGINDFSKWVLSFGMLLGRLEIFTLLVLLTPAFWRK
ncbi:MAG: potassium transporter [endosymbiont of Galathealinum brachiosum]|uniref:Trk system potassium uptake protein n=1 Tax=endosymbiont of Galathealinum brachiosum TaxID=2200906 RepID=A0A370DDA7_9GAMM|nr:MAG: potassium transporter [endosymbiont of Galathealinum brachiosum]